MPFLDFIHNRNSSPAVESLPSAAKAQAVDAARPAAQLMEQVTTPKPPPVPSAPTSQMRGRSLGMER